jgi:aspartyl-tRNA(Asn)/glutamyl-tRNA(Gln) amidotransferase subunit C
MLPALTRRDVEAIAALAQLELTDAEIDLFTRQLAGILAFAGQIRDVDTTGIPETSHVQPDHQALRHDEPAESLPRDAAFANAPDPASDAGLFKVPRVIGG